ncbi:CLIP domain-containing serine protease B9-like [Uranotaenia lowii]|uniref:CLIP domain-containing serine protease B9-like n=1 Tax=Uranotaenia lowii TaxID=190385 RepID=UPI0024792C27|nr:CLIP domain-containing serine protease B9-like [Uranotaenia lowii]
MPYQMQILAAAIGLIFWCSCSSRFFLGVSAEPWRSHEDSHDSGGDDGGSGTTLFDHYFVHHFDHGEPTTDTESAPSYSLRSTSVNCQCMKLRDCPKILDMLRNPKASYSDFNSKLKRLTCEYGGARETTVCCPLDDSWLADDIQSNEDYNYGDGQRLKEYSDNGNLKYMQNGYNKISKYRNKNRFITSFEDPKTLKNCPPIIYPDEEYTRPGKAYVAPAIRRRPYTTAKPSTLPVPVVNNPRNGADSIVAEPVIAEVTNQTPPASLIPESSTQRLPPTSFAPPLINDALCGLSVNTRIIGGEAEVPGQFPWMARLAYRNKTSGRVTYRCAGSLITNRHVITVAHCVTNLIDELELVSVRLGDLECNSVTDNRCDSRYQDFAIERVLPHSNYDNPKYANDIALVKLQESTETYNIISPLCLPTDQYSSYGQNLTGKTGIIAGWGSTSNRSNIPSPNLQYLRLPIVDTTQCASSYARYSLNSRVPIIVSRNQMCVQGQENRDACQGDSGGPLMNEALSSRDRFVLLGLVSFGPRTCGVSNFPGVYTRISSYIGWIMQQIEI